MQDSQLSLRDFVHLRSGCVVNIESGASHVEFGNSLLKVNVRSGPCYLVCSLDLVGEAKFGACFGQIFKNMLIQLNRHVLELDELLLPIHGREDINMSFNRES